MPLRFLDHGAWSTMLDSERWAGFAAVEPEHVFLMTGFVMPLHQNTNPRVPALALASRAGAALVVPRIQLAALAQYGGQELGELQIVTFGEFDLRDGEGAASEPARRLEALIRHEQRAPDWRGAVEVALEATGLLGQELGCDVPQATLGSLTGGTLPRDWRAQDGLESFLQLARRKNRDASVGLAAAARVAEESIVDALRQARKGVSQAELHAAYRASVARKGGTPGHVGIGIGDESVFPINRPSARKLAAGDVIKVDAGALVDGFFADTACVVTLGTPAARAVATMDALSEGYEAATNHVLAGVAAREVFERGVAAVRRAIPDYRRPHCGHGIGVRRYEPPLISPFDASTLVEGEVINVEIPFYSFELGGFNLEDTFVVARERPRKLTSLPPELLDVGEFVERATF